MAMPLVTIGICVRNAGRTLEETIQSIVRQDFPHQHMEIIFVDDGSEDNTLSIIESWASKMDFSVKIHHHKWKGLGPSRNIIFREAKGDYILWVDGDMTLARDYIRKMLEFMDGNPKVGIVKGKYGVREKNNVVSYLENIAFVAADYLNAGRHTCKPIGIGGCIYRIEALKKAGGFDVNIQGVGEDFDVEQRIRNAGYLTIRGIGSEFYEMFRDSWKSLWKEYEWHGKGGLYIYIKYKNSLALYKLNPIAGFFAGVYYSLIAYKLTHRKIVFLLPIQYAFKRLAWFVGFSKSAFKLRFQKLTSCKS